MLKKYSHLLWKMLANLILIECLSIYFKEGYSRVANFSGIITQNIYVHLLNDLRAPNILNLEKSQITMFLKKMFVTQTK